MLSRYSLAISLLLCQIATLVSSFQPTIPAAQRHFHDTTTFSSVRLPTIALRKSTDDDDEEDSWNEQNVEDFEILFKEEAPELDVLEKAWRYAGKPLLSIGAKGATFSHGNSLRQLLDAHTAVKVKVNTSKFGTLEKAFEDIRTLVEEAGGVEGIEMLQARESDKTILFALPGTTARLQSGEFPPTKTGKPKPEEK